MEETTTRPTQDGKPIYRIPEGNVESLEKRVEKLNRRAKKLGVEPLALALIGEAFETRTKRIEDDAGTVPRCLRQCGCVVRV